MQWSDTILKKELRSPLSLGLMIQRKYLPQDDKMFITLIEWEIKRILYRLLDEGKINKQDFQFEFTTERISRFAEQICRECYDQWNL